MMSKFKVPESAAQLLYRLVLVCECMYRPFFFLRCNCYHLLRVPCLYCGAENHAGMMLHFFWRSNVAKMSWSASWWYRGRCLQFMLLSSYPDILVWIMVLTTLWNKIFYCINTTNMIWYICLHVFQLHWILISSSKTFECYWQWLWRELFTRTTNILIHFYIILN